MFRCAVSDRYEKIFSPLAVSQTGSQPHTNSDFGQYAPLWTIDISIKSNKMHRIAASPFAIVHVSGLYPNLFIVIN